MKTECKATLVAGHGSVRPATIDSFLFLFSLIDHPPGDDGKARRSPARRQSLPGTRQ
mgnify:CR=1